MKEPHEERARDKVIRINDLSNPVLTDAHKRALEKSARNPVDLTETAVLERAHNLAGLDDFGPDDFRDRLRLHLDLVREDPNYTALGREYNYIEFVQSAITRLRLYELLRRHPEIVDIQVESPIIIVGPPRSGTSHLHRLLATDSRLRSLRVWEGREPIPNSYSATKSGGSDQRFTRSMEAWKEMQALLPYQDAMHSPDPSNVDEDYLLHLPDFPNYSRAMVPFPSWRGHYCASGFTPPYEFQKLMLKALQWLRGPRRWVLKSILHCAYMNSLLVAFPDATIVMTHRDPVAVLESAATMVAYKARLMYRKVDTETVVCFYEAWIENLINSMLGIRSIIGQDRIIDVRFDEFMADEIGTIERIYGAVGFDMNTGQRKRVKEFLKNNQRNKYGRVIYDLKGQFGVEPSRFRKRFANYCSEFILR